MRNKEKIKLQELLNDKVTIPAIQRDYAFGRIDSTTQNKRSDFVKKLSSVIKGEKDNLHLDFVYGKKVGGSFIPLDGQQRITTLWLLSIYIYKAEKEDLKNYNFFKNFSYATRTSTREFCSSIIEKDWDYQYISLDYFQNQKWFFNSWRFDPTIMGMLVVLEKIKNTLPDGGDINKLNNITFSFLDIEELGQPEELYVKMNSRGKQLSDWDNFKAELFELGILNASVLENDDSDKGLTYKEWIDTEFLDFFWNVGKNGEDKAEFTESRMLRFFKLNFFLKRMLSDDSTESNAREVIKFNQQNWKEQINADFLQSLKVFVDFIQKNEQTIKSYYFPRFGNGLRIDDLLTVLQKDNSDDGYIAELDLYFSYWQYIQKVATTSFDVSELANIVRIATNFEESYRKDYLITKNFLNSFDTAISHTKGIIQYFAYEDLSNISFGSNSEEQKIEEIEKAKLLIGQEADRWSKSIYNAELHPYFNGTIGWMLRFAPTVKDFESSSVKLLEKFDAKGLKDKPEISKMIKYEDMRAFNGFFPKNEGDGVPENRLRDRSWKRFSRDRGYRKDSNSQINIDWIEKWIEDKNDEIVQLEDWKQWIVSYPKILDKIGGVELDGDILKGHEWRVKNNNSKMFTLPIVAAEQEIGGFDYWGNMDENSNQVVIADKSVVLSFDSIKNEFVISKEENELKRVKAVPIDSSIERLKTTLNKL